MMFIKLYRMKLYTLIAFLLLNCPTSLNSSVRGQRRSITSYQYLSDCLTSRIENDMCKFQHPGNLSSLFMTEQYGAHANNVTI